MKLVTFTIDNAAAQVGVLMSDQASIAALDLSHTLLFGQSNPSFQTMQALIEAGEAGLNDASRTVARVEEEGLEEAILDRSTATLLAPIPRPLQMRDCVAFEKHLVQARRQRYRRLAAASDNPTAAMKQFEKSGYLKPPQVWYEQPLYYKQNRFSVVGHDAEVIWPRYSTVMDFELEFGVFIGKPGKNIRRQVAREHIFGYTIFNDFSARDTQAQEMAGQLGPAKGKDFDTGNVLGPWLVTADEIDDPYDLAMIARVNGEEWSRGNSGDMHHRFEDMIAHISADETLYPGEFIGSGTVGNGCGLELDRFLGDGDVVELEVEGLGVLRNRVRVQR